MQWKRSSVKTTREYWCTSLQQKLSSIKSQPKSTPASQRNILRRGHPFGQFILEITGLIIRMVVKFSSLYRKCYRSCYFRPECPRFGRRDFEELFSTRFTRLAIWKV